MIAGPIRPAGRRSTGVPERQWRDSHARDKSLYLSYLADSYLAAGEVEQAAKVTSDVISLSVGVASVRPRKRINPILEKLSCHRGVRAVAEVLEGAGV